MDFKRIFTELRLAFKYPFSINSQLKLKKMLLEDSVPTINLTFIVFIENEDFLEDFIPFHSQMGVDNFLFVNASENAKIIINKYKSLSKVEYTDTQEYQELAKIIEEKFSSNWIVSTSSNEFYYSKKHNLKESIATVPCAHILEPRVKLAFICENDRLNPRNCSDFAIRNFRDFEYEFLDKIASENRGISQHTHTHTHTHTQRALLN